MVSKVSPISASSFRAGMTKERRISDMALQDPPGDHKGTTGQHRPLSPRPEPQPRRHHMPPKLLGGIEAPGVHRELRFGRNVADELRNVERHGCPKELPRAKPRVTQSSRMNGLHQNDRTPCDAS